jgi:serine/threonine-protein kinase
VRDIDDFSAGMILDDRFVVGSFLGAGLLGRVFRATDLVTAREVALKTLRRRFLEMPGLESPVSAYPAARLLRDEIRIHRNLEHPRIVGYVTDGEFADSPWLAMDLMEQHTLESIANPLSPDQAVPLISSLLEGLAYLHDQGIVHRDLKPGNISLTSNSSVVIMDFTLALRIDEEERNTIASIMGSRRYGAPEQHRPEMQDEPLTIRSDLFSAGVVLERLLLGPSVEATATKSPNKDKVPMKLQAVLDSAMSIDPRERPADAREFQRRLDKATAG